MSSTTCRSPRGARSESEGRRASSSGRRRRRPSSRRSSGPTRADSSFESTAPDRYVVLDVPLRLRRGGPPTVRYAELATRLQQDGVPAPTLDDVRRTVLALRRAKSMVLDHDDVNQRSCGSFFVNPIVSKEELPRIERRIGAPSVMPQYEQPDGQIKLSAAWLIERAGFSKGQRRGAVGLSTRHALALVCHDGARASALVAFASEIRDRVRDRFGVLLVPEPTLWGFRNGILSDRFAD